MKLLALDDETVAPRRPRGRPKLEDVAQIESRLIDAALQEFLANGYGGTSLTRIVKAAGISKTTLYTRFSSKEDLFRAIIQRQIEGVSGSRALQPHKGTLDLVAGLKSYGNHTLETSLQGDLLEVNRLIYSESNRFPELGLFASERSQLGVDDVADFIGRCADADQIPCRDPRAMAEAYVSMLRGWYVEKLLTNRPIAARACQRWVNTAVHALVSGRAEW